MEFNGNRFAGYGMTQEELTSLKKIGIKYDKKSQKDYITEGLNPSHCTQSDIELLKKSINIDLPHDYEDFLLKTNGGKPEKKVISLRDREDKLVGGFYGVTSRVFMYTLRNAHDAFKTRLPDKFLAIGYMEFGDILSIDVSSTDYGAIFLFDHETELTHDEMLNRRGFIRISSSFTSLLNMLTQGNTD